MSMIQKVAEAINVAGTTWLNEQSERVEWYDVPGEILARAAIAAMREPSEEMIAAANRNTWQTMIDAALKEGDDTPTLVRR